MRGIILLSLILLTSCIQKPPTQKPKSVHQMIREVRKLDKTSLLDVSVFVRERQRGDITAINFSDFQYNAKTKSGFIWFDKKGLRSIRYDMWKGPKMSSQTLNTIRHCLREIGLESIKVDSCGNTSFTLYNERSYFIVKNKECLTARDTLNHIVLK